MIDHSNLEEFADAHAYDIKDSSDTGVAFYAALARETGGPVLELACGTGRVGIPIARLGFDVTGLDIVPGIVELARTKSAGLSTRWIEGDARALDLGERFRLIFLTGNAFQLFLTNADQAALLERVHAHLDDEGLFAFETRNPLWATLLTQAEQDALVERAHSGGGFFPVLETRDGNQERQAYDPQVRKILHLTSYQRWHEGDREQTKVTRIALRYTFPRELAALLQHNGFTILRQYGDWNHEPLTGTSPSIITVCHKRA